MKILITGGAGFIGSAVIRQLIRTTHDEVVNVDALTYAGSLTTVASVANDPRYRFEHANICDAAKMKAIFEQHRPDAVMHLAAESHVDRSIDGPAAFITTNVVGTYTLLETARAYWLALEPQRREKFRFHHISTDEVYGSLGPQGKFVETTPYDPSSPYSASKAGSDHLARAWGRTFGLPVLVTNCSNNYGPYQFPEKLIPLMITSGVAGRRLPVYGAGTNVRDWLYVEDHARALMAVVKNGRPGETYNIGGDSERQNIEVVRAICELLNERLPDSPFRPFEQLIQHVTDRPGHDHRYAIDASKIQRELGWRPERTFESGLRATVDWYLENGPWLSDLAEQKKYSGERLGLQAKQTKA